MNEHMKQINAQLLSEIKKESFDILFALDTDTQDAMGVNRGLLLRVIAKNRNTEF